MIVAIEPHGQTCGQRYQKILASSSKLDCQTIIEVDLKVEDNL